MNPLYHDSASIFYRYLQDTGGSDHPRGEGPRLRRNTPTTLIEWTPEQVRTTNLQYVASLGERYSRYLTYTTYTTLQERDTESLLQAARERLQNILTNINNAPAPSPEELQHLLNTLNSIQ